MDENVRKQANEMFERELGAAKGDDKPKADKANMPQSLAAIGGISGANLCETAPKIIDTLLSLLNTFSWFIPDNIEKPALAFLKTAKAVILPTFCGTAASASPAAPVVQTNVSQKAR